MENIIPNRLIPAPALRQLVFDVEHDIADKKSVNLRVASDNSRCGWSTHVA